MKISIFRQSVLSFLVVVPIGCSSPKSVSQLASQGVAITAKAESELDDYVTRSNRIYEQRLAMVRELSSGNIDSEAQMRFEDETVRRAGMQDEIKLLQLIRELSAARVQIREDSDLPPVSWTPGYATAALASYSAGES